MIQAFLSEEIKKMKLSVEEQIKMTEEVLNKKIDVMEGERLPSRKSARNSAKPKKK